MDNRCITVYNYTVNFQFKIYNFQAQPFENCALKIDNYPGLDSYPQ